MFCKKCGSELREGALFCPNCGNKVAQAEENISNNVPKQETNTRSIKKAEVKESKFDIKKYIPIIAVAVMLVIVIGAVVFRKPNEMGQNISGGNEQNQTEQNQTETQQESEQENESNINNNVPVQDETQEEIVVDSSKKQYITDGTISKDGVNYGSLHIWEYTELDNRYYYEILCSTSNGYIIQASFDCIEEIIEYADVVDYTVVLADSNKDHYLQLWTGDYDESDYNYASELKSNNQNYMLDFTRISNGDCVLVQTDTYVKVFYEIENDTYKGYEGLICDTEQKTLLQFVYLERKNNYDAKRVKETADSIDIIHYDYNQAG